MSGYIQFYSQGKVAILKWDKREEQFHLVEDKEEVQRIKTNLRELDRYLGPFPFDRSEVGRFVDWTSLIREPTLRRIIPTGFVTSMSSSYHSDPKKAELRFMEIPRERELDQSSVFQQLLHKNQLLEEVQLCFILLILGQNYESFEQWRSIIFMLCHCGGLVESESNVFIDLFEILRRQFKACPDEIFLMSHENRLSLRLNALIVDCMNHSVDSRLTAAAGSFSRFLEKRFGWQLKPEEEETGEYAPTIVDM